MMTMKRLILISMLAAATAAGAGEPELHQYVIERTIPGAQNLSGEELRAISQKSRTVLESLGPDIRWQHSYVAEDRFFCVYTAPDKAIIQRHADLGGFPADRILEVSAVIGPETAE